MTEILDIDVQKTVRKLPMDGVQDMVVILDMGKGNKVKTFTTFEDDRDTAALINEALDIYDPIMDLELE